MRQAFAQPYDPAEGIDHPEARAGRRRDQQPAIVGAEVDRREGWLDVFAARAGLHRRIGRGIGQVAGGGLGHCGVRTGGRMPVAWVMIRTCGKRGKRFPSFAPDDRPGRCCPPGDAVLHAPPWPMAGPAWDSLTVKLPTLTRAFLVRIQVPRATAAQLQSVPPPVSTLRLPVTPAGPLILFDTDCVLCSGMVAFVLAHEAGPTVSFVGAWSPEGLALAALHGVTCVELEETFLLIDGPRVAKRSDAALILALTPARSVAMARAVLPSSPARCVTPPIAMWRGAATGGSGAGRTAPSFRQASATASSACRAATPTPDRASAIPPR